MAYVIVSLALVATGVSYILHAALFSPWQKGTLHKAAFFPLWLLTWLGIGSILFMGGMMLYLLFTGAVLVVVLPLSILAIALGMLYQVRELFRYDEIRPFMRDSMFLRHSNRLKEDVFARVEQKDINDLAHSPKDRKTLREMTKKHIPMDRTRELMELETLRKRRNAEAGREEIVLLEGGSRADITDLSRLYHIDSIPHALFEKIFRMTIDPTTGVCQACVVFDQSVREHLHDAKRWFRFEQDLFDASQSVYFQDWMDRFKPYYTVFEFECYQEETDSFGLPRRTAFLTVGIPVEVLGQYKNDVFIATELERIGTIHWMEGQHR